jgi:hypothetical protein
MKDGIKDPGKGDAVTADHATSDTSKTDPAQTGTPGPSPVPKQP